MAGSIAVPANFSQAPESPALVASPEPAESSADSGTSSLFSGLLPAVLFLIVVATALAAGAFAVVAAGRRAWKWSDAAAQQEAASKIDPAMAAVLESHVDEYLAELEAAAEVAATDPDLLSRNVVPGPDER